MDLQEIIPFLVFVFWIVRSIIVQKRKADALRRNSESGQPDNSAGPVVESRKPRKPPVIFEMEEPEVDILEEIFGNKKATQPKTPELRDKPDSVLPSNIELLNKEAENAKELRKNYELDMIEFRKQIAKSFDNKLIHKRGRRKRVYSKSIIRDFDLQKAVIFSEILKRPYT